MKELLLGAIGVNRDTVSNRLDAYDREGLDGPADDARPDCPPFVPRDKLAKVVGEAKQFTAYGFVEFVEKRTIVTRLCYFRQKTSPQILEQV